MDAWLRAVVDFLGPASKETAIEAMRTRRYVVLDRLETVLGLEAVAHALDFLTSQGITVVTFSSEPALAARHDARMVLVTGGAWRFEPLHSASAEAEVSETD